VKRQIFYWLGIFWITGWLLAVDTGAERLFEGRQIHLSIDDNSTFSTGVTGTTAGYNYIALIKNAKQESISLGDLGYWELVADPPSSLRNYDLQLIIKNRSKGTFQIAFEYDKQRQDISYRIQEGAVQVQLDNSGYYPALIIDSIASDILIDDEDVAPTVSKRLLFFDFNSFDADLRRYYGSIKHLLKNKGYVHFFYYYESGSYNSYYFKTYKDTGKLDTDKMGLSLEDGTLAYYQKVLDNLKSRFGTDFADQIVIVSRFGKRHAKKLKNYAQEAGMSKDMILTFWSYDDIR
jgi:hypothetical protein